MPMAAAQTPWEWAELGHFGHQAIILHHRGITIVSMPIQKNYYIQTLENQSTRVTARARITLFTNPDDNNIALIEVQHQQYYPLRSHYDYKTFAVSCPTGARQIQAGPRHRGGRDNHKQPGEVGLSIGGHIMPEKP